MIYCSWFLGSMCHIIISLRIWCLSPRTKWSPLLVVFPQRRPLIGQKGPTVPIGSQTKPLCLGYILYIIYIIWYVFIYIYIYIITELQQWSIVVIDHWRTGVSILVGHGHLKMFSRAFWSSDRLSNLCAKLVEGDALLRGMLAPGMMGHIGPTSPTLELSEVPQCNHG